jgi:hypothetical protein
MDGYGIFHKGTKETSVKDFELRFLMEYFHYAINPFTEMNADLKECLYYSDFHKSPKSSHCLHEPLIYNFIHPKIIASIHVFCFIFLY